MKRIITVLCIFLLLATIATAAGGSTGGSSSADDAPSSDDTSSDIVEQPPPPPSQQDCELLLVLKERIECRLRLGSVPNTVPEGCRGVPDQNGCVQLYEQAASCYDKAGKEKDKCFKQRSGFNGITVAEEKRGHKSLEAGQKNIRNYLILLLYDLQERVEDAYDENRIDSLTAADLMAQITTIKIAVLNEKPLSEVKTQLLSLRTKWKEVML